MPKPPGAALSLRCVRARLQPSQPDQAAVMLIEFALSPTAAGQAPKKLSAFTREQLERAMGRPISDAEGLGLLKAADALGKRITRLGAVGTVH